jgi:hypothetical protein
LPALRAVTSASGDPSMSGNLIAQSGWPHMTKFVALINHDPFYTYSLRTNQ